MKAHRSVPATGIALAISCLVLLGILPIIADWRPDDVDVLNFAFLLSFWELMCSLPAVVRHRVSRGAESQIESRIESSRTKSTHVLIVFTGALFGIATYMYVQGVTKAGTIHFAIALQAYPVLAILWESIFLGRRKRPSQLVFTAILIGALYFLGTGGTMKIGGISIWFVFALGVPFLWSVAHVILKEVLVSTPVTPDQIIFSRLLISTIFLGIVLVLSAGPEALFLYATDSDVQLIAMLMGIVYYLELFGWFRAVTRIDVSLASSITTPAPIVTLLFAVILLDESVEWYQVIAMMIVVASLFGLILAERSKSRAHVHQTSEISPGRT